MVYTLPQNLSLDIEAPVCDHNAREGQTSSDVSRFQVFQTQAK